jgi:Holliday junction resolvase RusA-like endonuclease
MTEITLTIPLIPPSVNHYKMRNRRTGHWYLTKEALAFKAAVAVYARGASVTAKQYSIDAIVFLGKRQRGDGDNFNKCIGDGLKEAGVIHSDAAVKDWRVRVDRDWDNPRTVLIVRAI